MAVGDIKSGMSSVAVGGALNIMPPVGEEWVIHNIYYNKAIIIRLSDGTNFLNFDSDTTAGARMGMVYHLTNSQYLSILNNDASNSALIAYDGIQTK